jgi:hypothetical protein
LVCFNQKKNRGFWKLVTIDIIKKEGKLMKKLILIIVIMLAVLAPAVGSFAAHWGGHGHWGGGIYVGPGFYPYAYPYPYPYYYPYPAYSYPYPAQCETRCTKRVVPTCSTNVQGERICRDEVVRTCRKYCY